MIISTKGGFQKTSDFIWTIEINFVSLGITIIKHKYYDTI